MATRAYQRLRALLHAHRGQPARARRQRALVWLAALGSCLGLGCARRPALDVQSRAPEYGGSQDLPPVTNPQTLSAISGESAPLAAASGAAPAPQPVVVPRLPATPDLTKEGLYSFAGGGLELTVDPRSGNAVRFTLDGKDALIAPDPKPAKYTAELEGSTLVLKSADGSLSKRFRLDAARRSAEITYTVLNTTPTTLHANVADFHRVTSGAGLTFFAGTRTLLPGSTLKLNLSQPVIWFSHDQAREAKALEASVDSAEGWVASVNDGLVLVKVSSETSRSVISLASAYDATTKQRPWVEVGEQSGFELLPGASATCTIRLFLRKLPPNLTAKPGNQELLGFVRGIIQ